MSNKKGFIGKVIIILIVLFFLFAFISSTVIPTIKALPATAERQLIKVGILPAAYYNITPLSDSRKGHLEFYVTDPYGNFETGFQFPSMEGYLVSDNKVPTIVDSVKSYSSIYVAVVADSCSDTAYMDSLNGLNFNNTYVGFFPADSDFKQVSIATCSATGGNYWTAIRNATYSLTAGSENYKALLIVSDGLANPDDANVITDAAQGLLRNDLNAIYILTSNTANCNNDTNVLNITSATIAGARTKFKGCFNKTLTDTIISNTIGGEVKTIKVDYKPIGDIGRHNVTVKVTKRPYSGRYTFLNINYG